MSQELTPTTMGALPVSRLGTLPLHSLASVWGSSLGVGESGGDTKGVRAQRILSPHMPTPDLPSRRHSPSSGRLGVLASLLNSQGEGVASSQGTQTISLRCSQMSPKSQSHQRQAGFGLASNMTLEFKNKILFRLTWAGANFPPQTKA